MQDDHVDIHPGRLLSLGPRAAAVARGRIRVDVGPVCAVILAEAIAVAHALLRTGEGATVQHGWPGNIVAVARERSGAGAVGWWEEAGASRPTLLS